MDENSSFVIPTLEEIVLSRLTTNSLHELRCFSTSFKEMSGLEYAMEIELKDYDLIWNLLENKGFYLEEGKSFQKIKEMKVKIKKDK